MKPNHSVPLFDWNDRSRSHEHIQPASTRRRENVDIMSHRFQEDIVTPHPSTAIVHMEGIGLAVKAIAYRTNNVDQLPKSALIRRCICAVLPS